jgi:hypothetical protein
VRLNFDIDCRIVGVFDASSFKSMRYKNYSEKFMGLKLCAKNVTMLLILSHNRSEQRGDI